MRQVCTDREQSQRLTSCGVSKYTADMYLGKAHVPPAEYYQYVVCDGIDVKSWFSYRGNRDIIPAWSLPALLSIIPERICANMCVGMNKAFNRYHFSLSKDNIGFEDTYIAQYISIDRENSTARFESTSPIEACVSIIEWLVKNGHQLNK